LEWGISSANVLSACPAPLTTLTVDGFSTAVTCSLSSFTEAGVNIKLIQLRSVASSGTVGSVGYIERSLSASMEK
jgi:hypothetical protein